MIPPRDAWRTAWRDMGIWRWFGVALILIALALVPLEVMR